ncbi:hypothetical protein EHM69_10840 [candidate division KSB1 bacterium]|nr:MAG: hypothetical protein EHM69_10840 [candidate division KSB1 bacterium]
MKTLHTIILIILMIGGCSWNPDRDNPVDPQSRFYEAPPQKNRPPEIRNLKVLTDCRSSYEDDFCAMDIVCQISDPDRNIRYDTVAAFMDSTNYLGKLAFSPDISGFILRRTDNDFSSQDIRVFNGHNVSVFVMDDSGAVAWATTTFHIELRPTYPEVLHPATFEDTVWTRYPRLVWRPWNGAVDTFTYSVDVLYQNIIPVWSARGLSSVDTAVVVIRQLEYSNVSAQTYYAWYVTTVDTVGNRLTSIPGTFQIFIQSIPPIAKRQEETEVE